MAKRKFVSKYNKEKGAFFFKRDYSSELVFIYTYMEIR